MKARRDSLVAFSVFLKFGIGSATNEHLLIGDANETARGHDKICVILGLYAFVLYGRQWLMSSVSFPPYFTLWGRVSHWLAMLSVQWTLGIHLSWPPQYWYYRFMPQCLFLHDSGEPFSLHSKYFMEGNNLPSPSLSITRRWESQQMCPETIILYRIYLANFIFSLNITCLAMMRSLYLLI